LTYNLRLTTSIVLTPRQIFLNYQAQTSTEPLLLEIVRASGIHIYDKNNIAYVDLISGIGVSAVGHCHPKVVNAVKQQAETYMHLMVYGEYVLTPQTRLAEKLASLLPESLQCTYFVNSGAEAIEGALKLSKRATGRTEIISFENAYHGSTHGALSIMGNEEYKNAFRPLLPDIRILKYNIVEEFKHITGRTAAVVVETIRGEAGAQVPEENLLKLLRDRCSEVGALLIFDEVQCGIGRTGKMFAFEHFQIVPDILVLAKGLGGGMPIGAFIASQELMKVFTNNPVLGNITTFGGHPVNCAAALACLDVIEEEKLISTLEAKEKIITTLLKHPMIKSIRGKGLLWAVEFESFEQNKRIIDSCISKGVITDWFLFAPHMLRIAPPLIITEDELTKALHIILECVEKS
jgi:acetylornithine/N-succinyldiaminopimelate aminotransferase